MAVFDRSGVGVVDGQDPTLPCLLPGQKARRQRKVAVAVIRVGVEVQGPRPATTQSPQASKPPSVGFCAVTTGTPVPYHIELARLSRRRGNGHRREGRVSPTHPSCCGHHPDRLARLRSLDVEKQRRRRRGRGLGCREARGTRGVNQSEQRGQPDNDAPVHSMRDIGWSARLRCEDLSEPSVAKRDRCVQYLLAIRADVGGEEAQPHELDLRALA